MYRLVALDVDGTLLDPSHALSPGVRDAIHSAQGHGAQICLATGKLLVSVDSLLRELRLSGLHITCNGAAIMDAENGKPVATWALTEAQVDRSLTTVRTLAPEMAVAWYTTDAIYTDAPRGPLDDVLAAYHEPPMRHVARLDASLDPPLKFLMTGDHAYLLRLRDDLRHQLGEAVTVVRTTADFVEIMAPGISKGAALQALAARLGIARDEIVAIGDGENDIPLLEAAGLGIAMGNAMPALQARAAQHTRGNDEDGVAYALRELGLA